MFIPEFIPVILLPLAFYLAFRYKQELEKEKQQREKKKLYIY